MKLKTFAAASAFLIALTACAPGSIVASPNSSSVSIDQKSTVTPSLSATPLVSTALPHGCRKGDPKANVYHPDRLSLLFACQMVTGFVRTVRHEDDGDYHIDIDVDAPFKHLLNGKNGTDQHGYLVVEIVPADEEGCPNSMPAPRPGYDYGTCTGAHLVAPRVGDYISVIGPYVLDQTHGWNEIHPVWTWMVVGHAPLQTRQATPQPPTIAAHYATGVHVVSISPNPVSPGQYATLSANASSGAICDLEVTYASGTRSKASGLGPATANSSGAVSWTWKVGTRTGAGTATARVTCGNESDTATFQVS